MLSINDQEMHFCYISVKITEVQVKFLTIFKNAQAKIQAQAFQKVDNAETFFTERTFYV